MTQQQAGVQPAMTTRLIHGSLLVGVILFALVVHFAVRPNRPDLSVAPAALYAILGVSLAASAAGFFFLRSRVPKRNTDESADLFWSRATPDALLLWAPFEGAGLMGIVGYMLSGSPLALGAAAIALLGLLAFRPASLEAAR